MKRSHDKSVFENAERAGFHTLRGMKENARRGFFNGSRPPYGYAVESSTDDHGNRKGRLVVNQAEAPIVRRIFDLYVGAETGRSVSVKSLAAKLNADGLTYRGKPWTLHLEHCT